MLSCGFLHFCLPTIYNSRKASFHAIFQIWCQTGVRFLPPNAGSLDFTGFLYPKSSSSGIIFRFKHYHVLSRIYAFSNSLHQCIITHYYVLSFQNSLQFCCKNSFLLHEPTQGLFPKIHRIFVLNSSLIPFFSYLSLRHIYPSWFLCSHGP